MAEMRRYNPKDVEPKWQKIWEETGTYTADLGSDKPKYIAMSMFNYPSGAGIHIGHAMNYTISDVKARFKRQQGYESYHPVGWDAFGLPAENYAIKAGVSPQESMATIIPGYHKQYKAMGWSNDWEKEISTHLPEYYKWTQWIFSEMHRNGLAYQDARMQWWCSKCQTVLANEQVIDGKCWRHDSPDDPTVEKKEVKQWFFKITDYADELLDSIDALDWTESVKLAQKNWIGKSSGVEIDFEIDQDLNDTDFVFLHGFGWTHQGVFWPWLKKELEAKGAKVYCPDLPNTKEPNIEEQAKYVLDNYKFTPNTVIVTHSLGGDVAMKLIPKLDVKIKKLVMAAPPLEPKFHDQKIRPVLEKASDWHFEFASIRKNVNEIVVLEEVKDHVVPSEQTQKIAQELRANYFKVNGTKSHFDGNTEPEILKKAIPHISVFTTRVDTIFSAAFIVLAPENELVEQITTAEQREAVKNYARMAQQKSEVERQADREKTGVFTGAYAINPANDEKIPVWVGDFVLAGYGTGAVFGDIHDERDFEFLNKYKIPARVTVVPEGEREKQRVLNKEYAYTDEGVLIESGEFTGMQSAEAREKITAWLSEKKAAKEKVNYRMRDWSVSRQRYWGAPIPIVYCEKDGPVLVPDEDLPVELPVLDDFKPSGDGRSALARAKDWLKTECPKCGGPAERETDTLDTYICSSWYMYRYFDPRNQEKIFDSEIVKKWEPIDFYNGADHATAHLLYARFIGHFFKKLGLVNEPEPFKQFLFNGKVTAQDGQMFSKSKGNGVDPLEIIEQGYGADALRMYLMFAAPLDQWVRWDSQGVPGTHRFLSRLWTLVQEYRQAPEGNISKEQKTQLLRETHSMIQKVTDDLEENRYNTAIAACMGTINELYKQKSDDFSQNDTWQEALENVVACVAPFAPHIADELWNQLGHSNSVHIGTWPKLNKSYLHSDTITIVVQINGKVRANISAPAGSSQQQIEKYARDNEKVSSYLKGSNLKKVIYVKDKLLNYVL